MASLTLELSELEVEPIVVVDVPQQEQAPGSMETLTTKEGVITVAGILRGKGVFNEESSTCYCCTCCTCNAQCC